MASAYNKSVRGRRESIFQTALEEPRQRVQKPRCLLTIFQVAAVLVTDNLVVRRVYWKVWGWGLAYGEEGGCSLTDILGFHGLVGEYRRQLGLIT